jgi:hypothetical protein
VTDDDDDDDDDDDGDGDDVLLNTKLELRCLVLEFSLSLIFYFSTWR